MVVRCNNKILIEGQDFHVHHIPFPNRANPAMLWENPDGTYDIYINALYFGEEDRMREEFLHEIRHILLQHFDVVGLSVSEIERQAG